MKKRIIKEFDRPIVLVEVILYLMFVIIGYLMVTSPFINCFDNSILIPSIFYIFAFFSLLAYFINRRPDDYELLFFGLINIVIGTFISNDYNMNVDINILSNAILAYTLAIILNKMYFLRKLTKCNNIDLFPKLIATILITLLALPVMDTLTYPSSIEALIFGYYFLSFGLLSLFEPLLKIVIRNKQINHFLIDTLGFSECYDCFKKEKTVEKVKRTKKVKTIEMKKPKVKKENKSKKQSK